MVMKEEEEEDDDDGGSDKMAQGMKVLVVLVPRTQSGTGELTPASFLLPFAQWLMSEHSPDCLLPF